MAGEFIVAAVRPWSRPRIILSEFDVRKPTTFPVENIGSYPETATGPS